MSTVLDVVKQFFPEVTSVKDATKEILIEVTNKDASSKRVKDHKECALAVACKRSMKLDGVIISRSVAYLVQGGKATRYKLSPSTQKEVVSFDRGSEFDPGIYELARIPPAAKQGARVGRSQVNKDRTGKTKRFRHITRHVRSVIGGERPNEDQ